MSATKPVANRTGPACASAAFDAENEAPARTPPNPALVQQIMGKTLDDGGCAVWQHASTNGRHPSLRHEGKTQLVRRVMWEAVRGPIKPGQVVRMTCTTPNCVEAEHMALHTRKTLAKELGALGLMSGPVRSAAIARTKRRTQGKLSDAQVREIRSSNQTGVHIARLMGVSQAYISRIRTYGGRREFSNPWSQLL